MMMAKTYLLTRKTRGSKVYWAKKIRGQVHYFGPDYSQAIKLLRGLIYDVTGHHDIGRLFTFKSTVWSVSAPTVRA